jgi:hypothetical protein
VTLSAEFADKHSRISRSRVAPPTIAHWVAFGANAPAKAATDRFPLLSLVLKASRRVPSITENEIEPRNAVSGFPEDKMGLETRVFSFTETKMRLETPFLAPKKAK